MNSLIAINFYERFPRHLTLSKELPEPLRGALLKAMQPDDSFHLLIFGPADKTTGQGHAATALALLESDWLLVSCDEETSPPVVVRCSYANTLLVTFTTVLLRGRMEMDYAAGSRAHHVTMEFNTVMDHLYRRALQQVLDGMDAVNISSGMKERHDDKKLQSLPLRLQSVVRHSIPEGQGVISLLHWPTTYNHRRGLLRRELSPAAALLLTDREILLVSEEKILDALASGKKWKNMFSQFVLVDEINRASPRTQSALLEAMGETTVTAGKITYHLQKPFMVVATQNPIEQEGTSPLPEAQKDRFLTLLHLGYPALADEERMLLQFKQRHPIETVKPVARPEQILLCQEAVRHVPVERDVRDYMLALVRTTREHPSLLLGASPRATLGIWRMAQAMSAILGRDSVTIELVKALAIPVLAHRLIVRPDRISRYHNGAEVLREFLEGRKPE